ncbi:DUF7311 family protein [Haloarchaeobius sp. TZWWS8]|uniref:DUF7311 family protein n=1 Tax=Haloarchaeobius sp. TZWWS8 TaxID=3446121 RepID=UPI003EC0793D
MSLRVLLAVVLAAALLAASQPALETARETQSERAVEVQVVALDRAAADLVATEEATPGPGARRIATVRLPPRSWTTAEVSWVVIGGTPGSTDPGLVSYRLAGRRTAYLRLSTPVDTPGGEPLVVAGDGPVRLVLTLERNGVHVQRAAEVRTRRSRENRTRRVRV